MKSISLLQQAKKEAKIAKLQASERLWLLDISFSGWLLMALTLLVVASAFKFLRIPVSGLQMHLYLLLLIPLFLLYALPRHKLFPKKILFALGVFIFLFFLSITVSDVSDTQFALNEIYKIGAGVITIFTCALMVKTKQDFRIAVIGSYITATILAILNIYAPGSNFGSAGAEAGLEVIANKNAFSLYILPPLLFGSYMALDHTIPKLLRIMLFVCTLVISVSIFASGNRAGWVGALFIGSILLGRRRSIKSLILICVLAIGTYYVLNKYVGTEIFEQRTQGTPTQKASDDTRLDLITESFQIASENPVFGISPQELPYELASRLPDSAVLVNVTYKLDPHNVLVFIIAGSGFPCLFALALLGWTLWNRPQKWREVLRHFTDVKDSHNILRSILIIWLMQGMFTREILYHPSFTMAIGLSIGYCISQGLWTHKAIYFYQVKLTLQKLRSVSKQSSVGQTS